MSAILRFFKLWFDSAASTEPPQLWAYPNDTHGDSSPLYERELLHQTSIRSSHGERANGSSCLTRTGEKRKLATLNIIEPSIEIRRLAAG